MRPPRIILPLLALLTIAPLNQHATPLAGPAFVSAQGIQNPFIPNESIGDMSDGEDPIFSNNAAAQEELNSTLACVGFSVVKWIVIPIIILSLTFGLFWNMWVAIKSASSEAATRALWSLLGLFLFLMPINQAVGLANGTIVGAMLQRAFAGSQCPALDGAFRGLMQSTTYTPVNAGGQNTLPPTPPSTP